LKIYREFIKRKYVELIDLLENDIYFYNFRKFEYENMLFEYIKSIFEFIRNSTNLYFEYNLNIDDNRTHIRFNRTEAYKVTVEYKCKYKKSNFDGKYVFLVPKLVNNHFFFLRDNMYIPIIKLKTRYITFGASKIVLRTPSHFGLLLDLNKKSRYLTIMVNKTLPLSSFLNLSFNDEQKKVIRDLYGDSILEESRVDKTNADLFINYLSIFDVGDTKDINNILNNFIFGQGFVKEIYEFETNRKYNNVSDLIYDILVDKLYNESAERTKYDLIHIGNRKFTFIEDILYPLYNNVIRWLLSLSIGKHEPLSINPDLLITEFITNGKYMYDLASPYSASLANISVQMDGDVVKYLKSIHPSQKNIICPIATSSSEPRVQLHINPMVKLTRFGHIKDKFIPLFDN